MSQKNIVDSETSRQQEQINSVIGTARMLTPQGKLSAKDEISLAVQTAMQISAKPDVLETALEARLPVKP